MQSILQQSQSNPKALQDHMKNPMIKAKIQKVSVLAAKAQLVCPADTLDRLSVYSSLPPVSSEPGRCDSYICVVLDSAMAIWSVDL